MRTDSPRARANVTRDDEAASLNGERDDCVDPSALRAILKRFLRKRVPNHEVDDLAAEATLRVIQARTREREGRGRIPLALALEIARRTAADFHRHHRRRPEVELLSGTECQESRSGVRHERRTLLERLLADARPMFSERQQELSDQLFGYRSRTALARHMCMNLRDLDAALLALAKKIRRANPEIPPCGNPNSYSCS